MFDLTPLANKYRPKKFDDVVGQDATIRILKNSIISEKLHHAYIFEGFVGSGKTTSARVFAASLNNPTGPSLEPDMSSEMIQSIFEGKSVDVIEIDAASNRGIDDIRELKNTIAYAPIECRYKFVILDECHQLSGAAAQASLKMIEEPPPNVIFILCTTEANKLQDTIHSRCISLRFNSVHWTVVHQYLIKIANQEDIQFDEMALLIAAKKSRGSIRNALQNMQTIIAFAGNDKKISAQTASEALVSLDDNLYFSLVDSILKPDAGDAMRVIDRLLGSGRDVGDVLEGLVGHFRNLLIAGACKSVSGLLILTEDEKKHYGEQIGNIRNVFGSTHVQFILILIELLGKVNRDICLNINSQTAMETFCVRTIIESAKLKKM